jgi:D-alanine-D-alanine ligase
VARLIGPLLPDHRPLHIFVREPWRVVAFRRDELSTAAGKDVSFRVLGAVQNHFRHDLGSVDRRGIFWFHLHVIFRVARIGRIDAGAGLPVGPWEGVREPEWLEDHDGVSARIEALGFPVFVKPATLGSSVGISKVHRSEELDAAMDEAFRFARKAVVEQGFEGVREIECAVLGNDDPVASVCGEIVPTGHEFYDYASKYLDDEGARLDVPADLDPQVQARVQRMAVVAFQAVECWGMARVDFFLRGEELFINEINTIPGFTEISMYPKLWEASGLPYGALIERLIDLALERHEAERSKRTTAPELDAGGA